MSRRRKRTPKHRPQQKEAPVSAAVAEAPVSPQVEASRAVRPNPYTLAQGHYTIPDGPGRHDKPSLNLRPDCIAALMVEPAQLDAIQHDAARDWQELRAEVMAEIGARGTRSCLDVTTPGHDESEGNVGLAEHWRFVRERLGAARVRLLDRTCVEGAWPRDMDALREALDAFAVLHGGA